MSIISVEDFKLISVQDFEFSCRKKYCFVIHIGDRNIPINETNTYDFVVRALGGSNIDYNTFSYGNVFVCIYFNNNDDRVKAFKLLLKEGMKNSLGLPRVSDDIHRIPIYDAFVS